MKPIIYCFLLLLCGAIAHAPLSAQIRGAKRLTIGKMRDMSRDAGSAAGDLAKEEMQSYEASARSSAIDLKKNLPGRALGLLQGRDSMPKLAELIEDEQAKAEIEDRRNKARYVQLLQEWWALPSNLDLAEQRAALLARLKKQAANPARYLHQKKINGEEVIVFTWHPTWHQEAYKQYNYDRVNMISYYSYDVDPYTGFCLNPADILDFQKGGFLPHVRSTPRIVNWGGEPERLDTSYSKALLSVSLHGEENHRIFFGRTNINAQQTLIDSIKYLLDTTKADGIELNFVGVPADVAADFNRFVLKFASTVHAVNRKNIFVLSVPPFDKQNVYQYRDLTAEVDYFIILALDFHNENETRTAIKGPVSPFNAQPADQTPDIRKAVEQTIRKIGTYNASRLILALPNYGTVWISQGINEDLVRKISYDELMAAYVNSTTDTIKRVRDDQAYFGKIWTLVDSTNKTELPIRTEVFFDDISTLREKFGYALSSRVGGVAIHMLGDAIQYQAEYSNLLNEMFAVYVEPDPAGNAAKIRAATRHSQSVSIFIFTVLLYWGLFMTLGFVWALFSYQTRQALFDNQRFRTLYLAFFVTLLVLLGSYFGLFQYNVALLLVGLALGSFISWAVLKSIYKQQAEQP